MARYLQLARGFESSLGGQALQTFGFRLVNAGLGLAVGVVTARALGASGRGSYVLAALVGSLAASTVGGLQASLAFELSNRRSKGSTVMIATALWAGAIGATLAIALLLTGWLVAGSFPPWLLFGSVALPAVCVSSATMGAFLGLSDPRSFNLAGTIPVGFSLLMFIALVVFQRQSLIAFLAAWAAGQYLGTVWIVRKAFAMRFRSLGQSWSGTAAFLRFGLAGSLTTFLSFLNTRSDTFVVAMLLPKAQLGIYSIALVGAETLWFLSLAISIAVYGRIGSLAAAESAALTARSLRHTVLVTVTTGVILWLLAEPMIMWLFGPEFRPAGPVLRVVIFGIVGSGPVSLLVTYFTNQAGRPYISMWLAAVGAALNIALSVALVPSLGITGAALATTISYLAQGAVSLVAFHARTGIGWRAMLLVNREDLQDYLRLARRIMLQARQ